MTWMLALKVLFFIWLAVFSWSFMRSFLENDHKFGRFNWQIALLSGLFYSTVAPPWIAYDICKSPKKAYKRWVLAKFD